MRISQPCKTSGAGSLIWLLSALLIVARAQAAEPLATAPLIVAERDIDDLKAVFATVRSKDRIEARVRTPGTIVTLKVSEGDHVTQGQVLALVADPKIALKIKALDAQIVGLDSKLTNAKLDYDRAEQLRQRGITPQSKVDQLKTANDVAVNELKSARAERQVAEEQVSEGQVLAPAAGRVLKVPVTDSAVVMAGESIATIAANQYVLRLELPERHARFLAKGDPVRVGARGLSADVPATSEGHITQVYPELQSGNVLADAEVDKLGDFFVGERARVWISAGKRKSIVIPADYVLRRAGLDYVRLARDKAAPIDIVVQTGQPAALPDMPDGLEVLSGLMAGDQLVRPEAKP